MISKSLSTSEKRAALHSVVPDLAEFCQQLYPLLIAHSDDFGRLAGDTFTVKHAIDPTSPRPKEDFERALNALQEVGLIIWYTAGFRPVIQIVSFDSHQTGLHKRTRSLFPAPEGHSDDFPEIPSEQKRTEEKGTKGKGTELKDVSRTMSADDLVDLWNSIVTAPIPKVEKLTADRRRKFDARLRTFPDGDIWRRLFTWINGQEWMRASGRGDHPNWTATLDWLCKSDEQVQKNLEKASTAEVVRTRAKSAGPAYTEWDCPHVDRCGGRSQCATKVTLGPVKHPVRPGAAVS
jgi:hypothetical protein